jgi:DNA polymerase III subunit beta
MEVSIDRDTLLTGIGHILGVVDKRGSLPILSHCLLKTNGDGISISATDLEIAFQGHCPAEASKPGALTVQADYFHKLIKDLPRGTLILAGTDKNKLKVQAGDSRYELYGLPADHFPAMPEAEGENLGEIDGRLLKEMIRKTIFAAAGNDLSHLKSIFWEAMETEGSYWLRLVASDGHRLSLIDRPLPEGDQMDLGNGILVPLKGMREICRFVDGQEKVTLGLDGKSLTLQAEGKHLSVRLLDSTFPEYRRIFPEGFAYRFSANRQEFGAALNRLTRLSSERFKGVIFKLSPDSMEITLDNPEVGEGQEHLPVKLEEGDASALPLEVGFNASYLLEPLLAMAGDTVLLEINDRNRPCRLADQGDLHYFSIVMPMSLV